MSLGGNPARTPRSGGGRLAFESRGPCVGARPRTTIGLSGNPERIKPEPSRQEAVTWTRPAPMGSDFPGKVQSKLASFFRIDGRDWVRFALFGRVELGFVSSGGRPELGSFFRSVVGNRVRFAITSSDELRFVSSSGRWTQLGSFFSVQNSQTGRRHGRFHNEFEASPRLGSFCSSGNPLLVGRMKTRSLRIKVLDGQDLRKLGSFFFGDSGNRDSAGGMAVLPQITSSSRSGGILSSTQTHSPEGSPDVLRDHSSSSLEGP